MVYRLVVRPLILIGSLLSALPVTAGELAGLPGSDPDRSEKSRLALAECLLHRESIDSAANILEQLYTELQVQGRLASPRGLSVRLWRARARERNRHFSEAFAESLTLIEDSRRLNSPGVEAEALLLVALIYEQQQKGEQTRTYLIQARRIIEARGLHALLPQLFLRLASYHRLFGRAAQALLYSRLALAEATRIEAVEEQATAHVLLSMLYRQSLPELSMHHLRRSSELYRRAKGRELPVMLAIHLGDLSSKGGDYRQALSHSDSALHYAAAADASSAMRSYLGRIYDDRAAMLRQLGEFDSSFHYAALGRKAAIEEIDRATTARIAEIEARYGNAQKLRLIEEKERELERIQRRKRFDEVLIGTAVAALIVLLIFYLRLRRANKQLAEQSLLIKENNQRLNEALGEQQLLRGELHHRIKNNLQVIIGLLDMQTDQFHEDQNREDLKRLTDRVHSMSAIHDILYRESNVNRIPVDRFVKKLCRHFLHMAGHEHRCRFAFDLPDWPFSLDTLIPLGTMLNELLTNSCKHAAQMEEVMVVSISLHRVGERLVLTFRDNGPGYPAIPTAEPPASLGLHLLRGLSRQLHGWLETYSDGGAVSKIYFLPKNAPLPAAKGESSSELNVYS